MSGSAYAVPDILCGLKIFPIELYLADKSLAETESVNTALALAALRNGARCSFAGPSARPGRFFAVWLVSAGQLQNSSCFRLRDRD